VLKATRSMDNALVVACNGTCEAFFSITDVESFHASGAERWWIVAFIMPGLVVSFVIGFF